MNFEEIYKKYKDGTATDSEKEFIESEIVKARKISAILDSESVTVPDEILETADNDTFAKAKKIFNKKSTIKTILIVLICFTAVAVIGAGIFFGVSYYQLRQAKNYASESAVITEEEAIESAKDCIVSFNNADRNQLIVSEVEKDLKYADDNIENSKYIYNVEIVFDGMEYEIQVNASSGYAQISDIDREKLMEHQARKNLEEMSKELEEQFKAQEELQAQAQQQNMIAEQRKEELEQARAERIETGAEVQKNAQEAIAQQAEKLFITQTTENTESTEN